MPFDNIGNDIECPTNDTSDNHNEHYDNANRNPGMIIHDADDVITNYYYHDEYLPSAEAYFPRRARAGSDVTVSSNQSVFG